MFLLVSLSTILVALSTFLYKKLHALEHINFEEHSSSLPNNDLKILLICSELGLGGKEIAAMYQYKMMQQAGHHVHFLAAKNSKLEQELMKNKLPYFRFLKFLLPFKSIVQPGLATAIKYICKQYNISIIHCNHEREVLYAQKVAKNIPIILTQHTSTSLKKVVLKNLHGIIAVSPHVQEIIGVCCSKTTYISPFFNHDQFLNYEPIQKKHAFFEQEFKIKLQNLPIICMIANFYNSKNHPLLFKAIQKLIYEKNRPIQVVLAGDGPRANEYKELAKDLKIHNLVYFLGSIQQTPGLLFFSDINLLTSSTEAFGIVLLEGALMKKPIIIAKRTGAAELFIKDHQTGLLFEPDDVDSLIEKIELLLDNPTLAKTLGENAYHLAHQHFSNEANLTKVLDFYQDVLR
ncbi:MAG: glycosyltransferase family 4 protein [bacterium]